MDKRITMWIIALAWLVGSLFDKENKMMMLLISQLWVIAIYMAED